MLRFIIYFLFVSYLFPADIVAQKNVFSGNDTVKAKNNGFTCRLVKKSVVPVSLIAVGAIMSGKECELNFQNNIRDKVGHDFETNVDDYLKYAPVVELYGADILGVKAKNHWFDQTKYLLISNVVSAAITHGLKRVINKKRPDGMQYSMPSGHTTFAFTNATVLYNEFKENAPVLAYSGFVFSSSVGALRVLNNKHWVSDVLVGAGIGIFVSEMVYLVEPFKRFNPFKKTKGITLVPQVSEAGYSLYFAYQF